MHVCTVYVCFFGSVLFEREIWPCLHGSDLWSSNSGWRINLLLTSRNTDKRSSFHAVLSFILTPHSFPLMYFNVLLLLLLSDHSTSHHPHTHFSQCKTFLALFLILFHSLCCPETCHCSDLVKGEKEWKIWQFQNFLQRRPVIHTQVILFSVAGRLESVPACTGEVVLC